MCNVSLERDERGSLGIQITEGSDGNVYIQAVIVGGPAFLTGNVLSGDQVVAVDGHNLLGMKYKNALNLLTNTGSKVEFVLSRLSSSRHSKSTLRIGDNLKSKTNLSDITENHLKSLRFDNTMNKLKRLSYSNNDRSLQRVYYDDKLSSPVEKHLTESCLDLSNFHKYGANNTRTIEVPYHKHIRYEIETESENLMTKKKLPEKNSRNSTPNLSLNRNLSKSCTQIYPSNTDKAVIVDMIPKFGLPDLANSRSLDRRVLKHLSPKQKPTIPPIALPRSLGLSRKWRGPVKYPVTPVKKTQPNSDDEQVFI